MAYGAVKVDSITSSTRTISVDNIALVGEGGGGTVATQAEAEAGTENTKMMTPLRVAQAIDIQAPAEVIATQAEAQAGTENTKMMTPLRVKESITANAPAPTIASQAEAEAGTENTKTMTALRVNQAITAQVSSSTFIAATDGTGTRTKLVSSREEFVTSTSSATTTLNLSLSNVFNVTLAANITTFSWTNVPASATSFAFTLKVVQGGTPYSITWPASVKWPTGVSPALSNSAGNVDLFVFFTHDNGTVWYGNKVGSYT